MEFYFKLSSVCEGDGSTCGIKLSINHSYISWLITNNCRFLYFLHSFFSSYQAKVMKRKKTKQWRWFTPGGNSWFRNVRITWNHTESHGISWFCSTRIIWNHLESHGINGITWNHLESRGITWNHLESWNHRISCFPLGFTFNEKCIISYGNILNINSFF
jgi:hypothetical protein